MKIFIIPGVRPNVMKIALIIDGIKIIHEYVTLEKISSAFSITS